MKLITKIYGFLKNLTFRGVEISTEQKKEERLKICSNCPELNSKGFCDDCGCLVTSKVVFSNEKCPRNKWN